MNHFTLPDHLDAPERVEDAIRSGELWLAKDRMAGRLALRRFSANEHELYGWILLQMGDLLEAGRHLWCSCADRPEYSEAVAIFLARFGDRPWSEFRMELPGRVRAAIPSGLPQELLIRLQQRGADITPASPGSAAARPGAPFGCWLLLAAGLLAALFVAASAIVGAPVLVRWLAGSR
jgi:hypothetical protein